MVHFNKISSAQYEDGGLYNNDNENIKQSNYISTTLDSSLVPFSSLPRPRETRLLQFGERSYQRIFTNLIVKQKGLCHGCRNSIVKGDAILRRGKRRAKYYHVDCAKRLAIL